MISIRLLLLVSAFSSMQIDTGNRTNLEGNESGNKTPIEQQDAEVSATPGNNAFVDSKMELDEYSIKTKWAVPEFMEDLSGHRSVNYVASIKIGDLLGLRPKGDGSTAASSSILIGIKRPKYRIDKNPYVKGYIDLDMTGSILGVKNRGLITVSYYLKSDETYRRLSTTISIEGFSFRLIFPFGRN